MSYVSEATPVKQWRKSSTKMMTLPSENVIELKRVSLIDLIAQGTIPDTLSGMAANVATKTSLGALSMDDLKHYAEVVNLVVIAAAVEPKVAKASSDNALGVTEIDWVDRVQIFNWANGAANALRPFRSKAKRST